MKTSRHKTFIKQLLEKRGIRYIEFDPTTNINGPEITEITIDEVREKDENATNDKEAGPVGIPDALEQRVTHDKSFLDYGSMENGIRRSVNTDY